MAYYILGVLFMVGLLQLVNAHPSFRDHIPNGYNVTSPCEANFGDIWSGVGHQAQGGGGPRNPFGVDFAKTGFTWTEALCKADSDKDNRTNGEELGDPYCNWTKGAEPYFRDGLSHPGICEPLDNAVCREVNALIDCNPVEFNCDVVDEDPDIQSHDLRLDLSAVPKKETTYMCQVLDLPVDGDYHLVAHEPFIDNINVMHHILVYGCRDDAKINDTFRSPYECFMSRLHGCEEIIAVWSVGSPGICYHEDTGFRVGIAGFKTALIELHWNNPGPIGGYKDSSGITLYLTPNRRPYDAGMFLIGQMELEIPPGKDSYIANSTCSSECTTRNMRGDIFIVGAFNHMHYLGASALSQMVSHDGTIYTLSEESTYSYNNPRFVVFEDPIAMEPGYKLQLYCEYNSEGRSEVTYYGEGTSEEMCFAFIMYYPKTNWKEDDCISQGAYDSCGIPTGPSDGYCDYEALANPAHPVTAERNGRLYAHCEAGYCKEGCLDVVRDIFEEPCFRGVHLKNIKTSLREPSLDDQTRLGIYDYFYRLDSCNAELAWEKCWNPPVGGAVRSNMASFAIVMAATLLLTIL